MRKPHGDFGQRGGRPLVAISLEQGNLSVRGCAPLGDLAAMRRFISATEGIAVIGENEKQFIKNFTDGSRPVSGGEAGGDPIPLRAPFVLDRHSSVDGADVFIEVLINK